jgi:ABC-2 type transport system permease protein
MKALGPLYRLFVRHQLTAGRVVLIGAFTGFALLIGFVTGTNVAEPDRIEVAVRFASVFGMALMVPVISLVLASSALGDLVADETLVYLWHRPVPRVVIATAAWLSALTVAVPATAIPLAAGSLLTTGGDLHTALAVGAANGLAAVAYTGIFVLLGLVVRRSLVVGLAYVFIWELFVARVGAGAAKLSINTYPASVLARMTDIELPLAERSMAAGLIVPIIVPLVAATLTGWWLNRMDVA